MMLDTRIDHARIFDGGAANNDAPCGANGSARSVGITDGRLRLNVTDKAPAQQVVDAEGLALCPGFIDIHSHSDYAALYAPDATSKVLAGYTTELNGNCGYGAFPLVGAMKRHRQEEYTSHGLSIDWETTEEYFARCSDHPMALNQGLLIGHGTLRGSIMGMGDDQADRRQLRAMAREVERAMRLGCFGMSTGLVYSPGCFADDDEILQLARIVAEHGGLYASHLRSESDSVLEALDEFLSVCEAAGCRAQYSHIKTAKPRNWQKLTELRARMDLAKDRGIELCGDRYPYTASCTDLATILLPNAALGGGRAAIVDRLRDAKQRQEIVEQIIAREAEGLEDWFSRVMISSVQNRILREAEGKTLAQWVAHTGSTDTLVAAIDLLIEDRAMTHGIHFSMSDDNMKQILKWDDVMIGSDACLRDQIGAACTDHPHPRAFGTPARVVGQLSRDAGWFDLTTAVHKLTGQPAKVMRLTDRGLIRENYRADLVLFDPSTIADRATYESPTQPPSGIAWVWVNGEPVVRTDDVGTLRTTGRRPGEVLKFA